MHLFKAILLKVASAFLFAVMSVLVRWLGDRYPVGQVVFFRSAFAVLPVVIIYAWRGELIAALRIGRPIRHLVRCAAVCGRAVRADPEGARAHLSLVSSVPGIFGRAGDAFAAARYGAL